MNQMKDTNLGIRYFFFCICFVKLLNKSITKFKILNLISNLFIMLIISVRLFQFSFSPKIRELPLQECLKLLLTEKNVPSGHLNKEYPERKEINSFSA